jgi:hypothetical protein
MPVYTLVRIFPLVNPVITNLRKAVSLARQAGSADPEAREWGGFFLYGLSFLRFSPE